MTKIIMFGLLMVLLVPFSYGALTDNLTAYYSFDVDANDDYGTNHFTLINAPSHNANGGKFNSGYYSFTQGLNQYLRTSDANFIDGNNFTLSLWYNMTTPSGSNSLVSMSSYYAPIDYRGLTIGADDLVANRMYYFMGYSGALNSGTHTITSSSYFNNNWHHLLFVKNQTYGNRLYIDGVSVINDSGDFTNVSYSSTLHYFSLGTSYSTSPGNFLEGSLDEVGYWNRVLTTTEISNLYAGGVGFNPLSGNISLRIISPLNNTGITKTTPIQYVLLNVNSSANCSYYVNGTNVENSTGLINGTFSFSFNSSNWVDYSPNDILINCTDISNNVFTGLNVSVKTSPPQFLNGLYSNPVNTNAILNNSVHSVYPFFNYSVEVNNTYLNALNISVGHVGTGTILNTSSIGSLGAGEYLFNNTLNFTGKSRGLYEMNVTISDIVGDVVVNDFTYHLNLYYLYSTINVTLYDSETLGLIKQNITIQYVGSNYQDEVKTTTGSVVFNVSFDLSTDEVNIYAFQNNGSDYTIVSKHLELAQGTDYNLSMYMTNTSDLTKTKTITFKVLDEDKVNLENAIISIYKRNPSTGANVLITDLLTNPNGEASTILTLDTVFYTYIVNYGGNIVFASNGAHSISTNDDTIILNCVVGKSATDSFLDYQRVVNSLKFTRNNNVSGYYTVTYYSPKVVEICLETYYFINTVRFNSSTNCQIGTQGTLNSDTITVSQYAETFTKATADFSGDDLAPQPINSFSAVLGLNFDNMKKSGRLIVFFGIIILSGIVFIKVPVAGLIILCIGTLALAFTHFTMIDTPFAMLIISLAIFVIITISKNERK